MNDQPRTTITRIIVDADPAYGGGPIEPVPPRDVRDGGGDGEGVTQAVELGFQAAVPRVYAADFAPFYDALRELPMRWPGGSVLPLIHQSQTFDGRAHVITFHWEFFATARVAIAAGGALEAGIQELAEDLYGSNAPRCMVHRLEDGVPFDAPVWFGPSGR